MVQGAGAFGSIRVGVESKGGEEGLGCPKSQVMLPASPQMTLEWMESPKGGVTTNLRLRI